MCTVKFIWLRIFILLAGVFFFAARSLYPNKQAAHAAPRSAVIVELFTSEGCSSCPPADSLLSQLRQKDDQSLNGIEVIPLGFHVDYWNSLGWQDRFCSHAFSQRQENYAAKLSLDGPYTPQMVVNGTDQFVGSDSSRAHSAIARAAAAAPQATVELKSAAPDKLAVTVRSSGSAAADVVLAVTEDNLSTKVGGGENGGRVLHHAAVVRELLKLGQLERGGFAATVPLQIKKNWKRDDLRVIVFVQDGPGGRIQGAASVTLATQLR